MVTTYRKEIKSYLELVPTTIEDNGVNNHLQSSQIQHKCSSDPAVVRQEVDTLRKVCDKLLFLQTMISNIVLL